ncbi:MAG: peptide transporter [Helicobacteraceae bacterium]|jgi:dolichyl-diphosphooligosaccharide--protein glycosyltransferase/undecaprenyl-diphosphooligosaccharide--protein glycosyltransferase|nr:peptide transporter [Helicobacteraceae bacterium]
MDEIANFFKLKEDRFDLKTLILLIFIAWAFGVICRMYWIYVVADVSEFYWLGQFMINTNDGYYWAEGARDLLENPSVIDELSPVGRGLPIITAFLAKCLPFLSFETLILYMPAFIGSLLAIPIVLIGRAIGATRVGFVGAMIAVIAWSYYNRTMIGYYDDDMLVLVLPTFVLYALIAGICSKKSIYLLLSALFAFASVWYYHNSQLIIFGMAFILLIYAIVSHINGKNGEWAYNYKLLLFLALGAGALQFGLAGFAAIVVVFAIFAKFEKQTSEASILFSLLAVTFGASLYFSGAIMHFWHQFAGYIIRDQTFAVASGDAALHFVNVAATVREAGEIPFVEFSSRISGHPAAFFIALIGTILLLIRHRTLALALPFIGMGFMAYGIPNVISGGGLRFTIYAVPIMALGISYVIFLAANIIESDLIRRAVIAVFSVAALLPHLLHINAYIMPTVFYSHEVEQLNKLKEQIETRKDYAISWWDYGYPIRYYAYAKTLADGGKHGGADNYAPSLILSTDDQTSAARMARLAVEYTERQIATQSYEPILSLMMSDYNVSNPERFLYNLGEQNLTMPEKTREVYLVLPQRMSDIFGTVMRFSSIELASGRQFEPPFFLNTRVVSDQDNVITLVDNRSDAITIDRKNGTIQLGSQKIPIKHFFAIGYDQNEHLIKRSQAIHQNGSLSVIALQYMGAFLLVDDRALNSVFIQLFALENYDPSLFEPIILSPLIKIYRVLI